MSEDKEYMEKPCKDCPFRHDVKPFLHPDRASEIANATTNPYNFFPCHKTTKADEDTGERYQIASSKQCAGFLTMKAGYNGKCGYEGDGFEPSWELIYADSWEMEEAYEMAWES